MIALLNTATGQEAQDFDGETGNEIGSIAASGSMLKLGSNDWVRFNLDSGASCATFPSAWSPGELTGSGVSGKTASGEMIEDKGGCTSHGIHGVGFKDYSDWSGLECP